MRVPKMQRALLLGSLAVGVLRSKETWLVNQTNLCNPRWHAIASLGQQVDT